VEDANAEVVTSGAGVISLQVIRVITVTSVSQTWYLVGTNGGSNAVTNVTFDAFRLG